MKKFLIALMAIGVMVTLTSCVPAKTEEPDPIRTTTTQPSKQICSMGDFAVQAEEEFDRYVFTFSVYDENGEEMKAPVVVQLSIVNDADVTVYTVKKTVTEADYHEWSTSLSHQMGVKWLKAAVHINFSDITVGLMDSGKVHYEVLDIEEQGGLAGELDIFGLPATGGRVKLPAVPQIIHDYSWDEIDSSVKVTDVSYEIKGDSLYLYFTGEKLYDQEGGGYSQSCKIGWKLYDSEEYVVASGVFYSPALKMGEKFRNEEEYVSMTLSRGETYKLVLENVD